MLLIDDGEAQVMKFNCLLDDSVGPDHHLNIPILNPLIKILSLRTFDTAGQESHPNFQWLQPSMKIKKMLFCQNLGGRHNGSLIAALNHTEASQKGDNGLTASHISLDQSIHGMGLFQILLDFR